MIERRRKIMFLMGGIEPSGQVWSGHNQMKNDKHSANSGIRADPY